MCRITTCPVVLTENGFMSNAADLAIINNDAKNTEKAKAITRGIVDYFNSIRIKSSPDKICSYRGLLSIQII